MTHGLLVAGWAHPESCLTSLSNALRPALTCQLCSPQNLYPHYAERLHQLIVQTNAEVLIGWSLGGLIALDTILSRPSRIRALVLVSSTPRFCQGPDYDGGVPLATLRAMKIALQHDPVPTLRQFHRMVHAPDVPAADATEDFTAQALKGGIKILADGLEYLATTDLRSKLFALAPPVLLVHGDADVVIPSAASAYMAANVPRTAVQIFRGKGHGLPLTSPCDVAQVICDFLNSVNI
jgi:pimeloyl-[acyl-carrier protein] methyl ester esterase